MTIKSLKELNDEYEKILHSNLSADDKGIAYAEIMTYMESAYKVPILQDEAWEKENKSVIAMYRKLSNSRNL